MDPCQLTGEYCWRSRLRREAELSPLIASAASRQGLAGFPHPAPPRRVMVGIGLCSGTTVSRGLPIDVLGLLLSAESLRRTIGARWVTVLVADEHARRAGADPLAVARQTRVVTTLLARCIRCELLPCLEVLRAGRLHHERSYQRVLADVERRAHDDDGDYLRRQLADMHWLASLPGGTLKLGWALDDRDCEHRRDEVAFDQRYRQLCGNDLGFVYCKPGRTLDPLRPKASPYIVLSPRQRVLLEPAEASLEKVDAAPREAARGVKHLLRAIIRVANQTWSPLRGSLSARLQGLFARLQLPATEGGAAAAEGSAELSALSTAGRR